MHACIQPLNMAGCHCCCCCCYPWPSFQNILPAQSHTLKGGAQGWFDKSLRYVIPRGRALSPASVLMWGLEAFPVF